MRGLAKAVSAFVPHSATAVQNGGKGYRDVGGGEAVELPKQRSCSATGRGEERFCLRMGGGWAESAAPNVRSVYGKAHFNIRPQTSARRALVVCPLQSYATGWGCDWIGDRNEGDAGGDRQDGGGVE